MEINNKNKQDLKFYIETLNYFKYAKNTIESYSHYLTEFLNKIDKYHAHIVSGDFDKYLKSYNFTSTSQQNQIISSIKFFYEKVLKKKYNKIDFSRPRSERTLPQVIDKTELKTKILSIQNIKHKAILALAYSTGMRVSEVINLKIKDIDSTRMLILIQQSKGKTDRYVPLSEYILKNLREYYKKYKPKEFLFNGQFRLQYSAASCNKIMKKYIRKDSHFHQLRHSSFTSLLEAGTDIRIIQKLAGHKNSKTTEIYTHVSNDLLQSIPLPI